MNTQNKISAGLIQACFESEFYPLIMSGVETNDPAFRLVGQIALHTHDAPYIEAIVNSALPEGYDGDTHLELPSMIERTLKKAPPEKIGKGKTLSAAMLSIAENSGMTLFHDPMGVPYITVRDKGLRVYPLQSEAAETWLKKKFYTAKGSPIATASFKEALDVLKAKAVFDGPECKVHLRVARHDDGIVLNMADVEGKALIINSGGYEVTVNPPVFFCNSPMMAAIPAPEGSDEKVWQEFKQLLGLGNENFYRILAFIINAWKPDGPYLILLLEGEQGSGKSLLTHIIKTLVDPSPVSKLRMPKSEQDLMIQAKASHLMVFDNLSGLNGVLSDALCSLATGGGYSARKLYTDDEQKVFFECRPVILNGINGIATRPDLLDRSVSVKLPSMATKQRKVEADILRIFEEMRPRLIDQLCKIASCALRNFDEVIAPTSLRMADAAQWLVAAEPATGLPEGTLVAALEKSQTDIVVETMSSNSLAVALMKCVENAPFEGTMGELYARLEAARSYHDRSFPPTSAHLSRVLERLRPALMKTGIAIEFGPKTRKGKMVSVRLLDDQNLDWLDGLKGESDLAAPI